MYSNELVCNIIDYLNINLYDKIKIENLENKYYYNRYYIMKLFKKELGLTIIDYINKMKIYNSILEINQNINITILNISLHNGFYSLEYFSEIFKKEIGISPKKYQIMVKNRLISYPVMSKIIKLKEIKDNVLKYKTRLKPKNIPTRKLSIFD